jgi:hypothetical protein
MKTLKCLLAVGSLLAAFPSFASAQVAAVSGGPGQNWLTHYYQNPRPAELPLAAHRLSREGYFEGVGQTATAIGFFATVFAQNPQDINYWLHETVDLPAAHRRVLVAAAWLAGSPRGSALLREMSENSSWGTRIQITDLLRREPTPVAVTPVRSESSMNLQWGAFLASGEEQHIVSVLAALGSGEAELSATARYTLAQNATEHRRVLDICRDQLAKQPESVRSELRAALNDAGLLARPGA